MDVIDAGSLQWNDNLCVGVAEIDEQHRILVNTLNEAHAKLCDDSSPEQFEQITRDLLSYALYHFETEEEIMKRLGYAEEKTDECHRHLQEHRNFSATVVNARENLKSGKPVDRRQLLSFLNDWLVNHILKTDKLLARFVHEKEGH
jgi:hemerythrin-like metal-binding protein